MALVNLSTHHYLNLPFSFNERECSGAEEKLGQWTNKGVLTGRTMSRPQKWNHEPGNILLLKIFLES